MISDPTLGKVVGPYALRAIAAANECAFWSPRAAMGGKDSIAAWLAMNPPRAHPDHVHLNELGYRALARLLLDDWLAEYALQTNAIGQASPSAPPRAGKLSQ